jgi:hypothetical protein
MSEPPDSWIPADQQPIRRVIGRRVTPPIGRVPSREIRYAMDANARYGTRAPKGVFFYESHEQMVRDRERWTVDAMVLKLSKRA